MSLIIGSLQLSLIYSILAMGVYISFRVLKTPDLTAEGSFTLGMAIMTMSTINGHPILGIILSIIGGAVAGLVTGFFQTKLKIPAVLSGILTTTGLYTINLMVMKGSSNLTLIGVTTVYDLAGKIIPLDYNRVKIFVSFLFVIVLVGIITTFFKTNCGLCIRAIGDNEKMARSSSMNVDLYRILALMISNGLIALSGGLIASDQGYADMNSGTGMLVVGLAAVVIGEAFIRNRSVLAGLISCLLGSIVYRIIMAVAVKTRVFPAYSMKLISAIIVTMALSIPVIQHYRKAYKLKRRRGDKNRARD